MDPSKAPISLPPAPEWVREKEWTPEQQIQELQRRMMVVLEIFFSDVEFTPRPSDVIVATPVKSGTTWLMHICHQLRMGGSEPNFEVQEDVITALDFCKALEIDPNTKPQPAEPRLFMTHMPYLKAPKGGKLITCMREPSDLLLSMYRFVATQASFKGRVALPIFCNGLIKSGGVKNILLSLVDWWEHRHDQDVLFLFFDDLKEDHIGCVRRIAKFIGVNCSEEVISRVVFTTTHAEMARHHSKFDSYFIVLKIAELVGDDPPTESVGRVRKGGGKSGEGKNALPLDVKQQLEKEWEEIVTAKLGFKDCKEMWQAWKSERRY